MVKVSGLDKIAKELKDLKSNISPVIDRGLEVIATEILNDAVSRVHVISGYLRSTAFIRKIEGGWSIGFSARYAAFEEFGTGGFVEVPKGYEDFAMTFKVNGGIVRNGEAHPFLFPAFLKRRDDIVNELEQALRKYVKSK